MIKVAVIGARCRRQGIGEHVARWFARAGAAVCAVVGTSDATVTEARRALESRYGIECPGFLSVEEALDAERPDVVAICSPLEFHRRQLEVVAHAGVHCLCEKPFWWGDASDRRKETERLIDAFTEHDRHIALITQWPYTLPAFFTLHPQVRGGTPSRVGMRLSPISTGPAMVLDSAPHLISLLQALAGRGEVVEARAHSLSPKASDVRIEFVYRGSRDTAVELRLTRCVTRPRPASYSVDGYEVQRRVDLERYEMYFESGDRRVRLDDPLGLLVRDFVRQIETGARADRAALVEGIGALETLLRAVA